MLRKMLVAVGLGITAAFVAVSPAMATYPPSAPTVGTPSSSLTGGASTTISGTGWEPGTTVQLTIASSPQSLGSTTVAGDGTFAATVSIPCLDAGTHTITASGTAADGSARSVATTVTLAACGSTTGTLPHTGGDTSSLLTIVAVALLVGAVLVIAASRKRSSALSQR